MCVILVLVIELGMIILLFFKFMCFYINWWVLFIWVVNISMISINILGFGGCFIIMFLMCWVFCIWSLLNLGSICFWMWLLNFMLVIGFMVISFNLEVLVNICFKIVKIWWIVEGFKFVFCNGNMSIWLIIIFFMLVNKSLLSFGSRWVLIVFFICFLWLVFFIIFFFICFRY